MNAKTKKLLIIILAVAVAAGAGLYFTGIIGGSKESTVKASPTPIPLNKPFVINLADTDADYFIKLQLAVKLDRMNVEDLAMFKSGGVGGHGGGKPEDGGPFKVAAYPPFHDAVIEVTSRFTSEQLLVPSGKKELKKALLERFDQIAQDDAPVGAKKGEHANPAEPPYHVTDISYMEFAIQAP